MNATLQGQLQAEVDHLPVITITRAGIDENAPGTVKKGGYGVIGIAEGIGDGSGSFTLSVVKDTAPEVDVYRLRQMGQRFTFSYKEGANRLIASGCKITRISRSNDPGTGNYDLNCAFIFGDLSVL